MTLASQSQPFFSTTYIRLMHRLLGAVDDARLFAGTNSSASALTRVDVEMAFDDQMTFCRNALQVAGADLGLRLGPQFQLASHGPLGTAMQTAATLEAAITTFSRLIDLRASMFSLQLKRGAQTSKIEIHCRGLPNDLLPLFTEGVLHSLVHCLNFFSGRPDAVDCIELGYPPPTHADSYQRSFASQARFAQPVSALRFDTVLLGLASPTADPSAHELALAQCGDLLRQQQRRTTTAMAIEQLLWSNPGKLWRLDELAPKFACSSRTLIRRLASEGTSYQAIRDKVLQQRARSLLATASVEATAVALGFADAASFRRTYKRWFGVTPNQRKQASFLP